jgi:hypothetical protein
VEELRGVERLVIFNSVQRGISTPPASSGQHPSQLEAASRRCSDTESAIVILRSHDDAFGV